MHYAIHPSSIFVRRWPEPSAKGGNTAFVDREVAFVEFIETVYEHRVAHGYKNAKRLRKFLDGVRGSKPGQIIEWEDHDWELARSMLEDENPQYGILVGPATQCLGFLSAIVEASVVRPEGEVVL